MSILEDLKLQYKIGGVANKLIYWNVGLFAIPYIVFGLLTLFNIKIDFLSFVSLSSNPASLLWKPWTLISYAFFHAGILHILFNMIMLHFSSRLFTTYFTQKQLLGLYILGSVFAGLIYIVSYFIFPALSNHNSTLVGASGAVMAILFATVTYNPLMELRLFLIGNVKLWHIALFILIVDLIQLPIDNTGGHLAHLGGAFFGFLFVKSLQNGTDLSKIVSSVIDFFVNLFKPKKATPFKKVHKNYKPEPTKQTVSRVVTKDKTQQQIDEILDKISQSGYDSLTKEEKEFLFKAGK